MSAMALYVLAPGMGRTPRIAGIRKKKPKKPFGIQNRRGRDLKAGHDSSARPKEMPTRRRRNSLHDQATDRAVQCGNDDRERS
jgi:hypothetical protein